VKIVIVNRWTGKVIVEGEYDDIKSLLRANNDANLCNADLRNADLCGADLRNANLCNADLCGADLRNADLCNADLCNANLRDANLCNADLCGADLCNANLRNANLCNADLCNADLCGADLKYAKNMVKIVGVEVGNFYWKRCGANLINQGFQYFAGINSLPNYETFANDEQVLCSAPGLHFASRSWCAVNYPDRPYEAKIRIPEGAQINEPWATDGKASADRIEIIQIFDVKTGEDVTVQFVRPE
jgi:hypothetical protein